MDFNEEAEHIYNFLKWSAQERETDIAKISIELELAYTQGQKDQLAECKKDFDEIMGGKDD